MMENIFRISIALRSEDIDFSVLSPEFQNYKITYTKKGDSVIKGKPDSTFRARSNAFIISDIYITNKIDYDFENNLEELIILVKKINSFIDKNIKNINREIRISGQINDQQFGIGLSSNFINIISEYNYSIVFSGVAYLEDEHDS